MLSISEEHSDSSVCLCSLVSLLNEAKMAEEIQPGWVESSLFTKSIGFGKSSLSNSLGSLCWASTLKKKK